MSLALLTLLPSAAPDAAAQKKNFKAACLNVDGMPYQTSIMGIKVTLNKDSKAEVGARQIGELVAKKGWDFIGLSEDFNYHDALMEPLSAYYNAGTFRNKIDGLSNTTMHNGKLKVDTDGLGFLCKKVLSFSNETFVAWNTTNGYTSDGSDELILKGYRYYVVDLGQGLSVDVYSLHMDAETTDADNAARVSQLQQLVAAIKASDNKRPIIVMGDTNCRYTRDPLTTEFINAINADSRFNVHDPWVDFMWEGVPPVQGTGSLMVDALGQQKGEVVDKIFYINNTDANGITLTANSYLHDDSFVLEDGSPAADHFPIVIDFTIENTRPIASGGLYFLRNKATGTYLNAGGKWDTQAVLARTGMRFSFTQGSRDTDYIIRSTLTKGDLTGGFKVGSEIYLDGKDNESQLHWNVTQLEGGAFSITYSDYALTATASNGVTQTAINTSDPYQQWEILNLEQLKAELNNASVTNPMDATFFFRGFNFGRNDDDNNFWTGSKGGNATAEVRDNGEPNCYSMYYFHNNKQWINANDTDASISQIVSVPNGVYNLECDVVSGNSADNNIKINGSNLSITNEGEYASKSVGDIGPLFVANSYHSKLEKFVVTDGSITFQMNKARHKSETAMFVDNIRLTYLGLSAEEQAGYDRLKAAIDDAQAKADAMGLTMYDNRTVVERWENRQVEASAIDENIRLTYEALATAVKAQSHYPADMSYACLNNSFEMGSTIYWDATAATSPQVVSSAGVANAHEAYVYKANGGSISQSITLPNGVYRISALLSEGATLTVTPKDGTAQSVTASGSGLQKVELTLKYSAASLTVALSGTGAYTADNLQIICLGKNAAAYDLLQAAINDANARAAELPAEFTEGWDNLTTYQEMIDNYAIEGDGWLEFYAIYDQLRKCVVNQTEEGSDMTSAIINPGFELGQWWNAPYAWTTTSAGDTKCAPAHTDDATYGAEGMEGWLLFNTWDGDATGYPVSQTIRGLRPGKYRLTAKGASHANYWIYIFANDNRARVQVPSGQDKTKAQELTLEFDLAEGEALNIGAVGGDANGNYVADGGQWYKIDDFRLTLITPAATEISVGFPTEYHTLILPYDHDIIEGMTVYEAPYVRALDGADHYFVDLKEVDRIMANTPYVVRISGSDAQKAPARAASVEKLFSGMPVEASWATSGQSYTSGVLTGVHSAAHADATADTKLYTLDQGASEPQFVSVESADIDAHHAYISLPANEYATVKINSTGVPTGIDTVEAIADDEPVDVFTVAGVHLCSGVTVAAAKAQLAPGLYIVKSPTAAAKLMVH